MLIIITSLLFIPTITNADNNDLEVDWFEIMPKLTWWQVDKVNTAISSVGSEGWMVRKNYNVEAQKLKTSEQLASWIMNRDTIMNYIVFVVQFLSQLWLLVWVWFIMYAWYKYMLSVFNWWKTPGSTLKNAIIWVIIIIFSYAIMKILTSIIWLT
jgi:hypothetical protein